MNKSTWLALAVSLLALESTRAFNPQPDPPGFGMVGITPGETLRLNVANPQLRTDEPPDPCIFEISFVDGQDNLLLPAVQKILPPGQSASFDLDGALLATIPTSTPVAFVRTEVRPVVRVLRARSATGNNLLPPGPCVTSFELIDKSTGKTLVTSGPQNPGVIAGFNPQPDPPGKIFGPLGIVSSQTIRLNAVNLPDSSITGFPPGPCRVTMVLFAADGSVLVQSTQTLQPGAAAFLDYTLPAVNDFGGDNGGFDSSSILRAEIRGLVTVEKLGRGKAPPDPCRATVEVFDNVNGRTTAIQSPQRPQL